MRFHVVALPHTHLTDAFSSCAYTNKLRGFCRMMKDLGHTVFLYAGEQADCPFDEHVVCISEAGRAAAVGSRHYTQAPFGAELPHWQVFNMAAIAAISARIQPRDFICLIGGHAHKPIADAVPAHMSVEWGIGYSGTFSQYRVWESHAWMHTCWGAQHARDPNSLEGRWLTEAVIPGYLDPGEFPFGEGKDGYVLFVGRLIELKGVDIAVEAAKRAGVRLVLAGPGTPPPGVEHVGVVEPAERGRWMGGALALLAPTRYVEPFGNVAIEAMACGTPVIASDFGAFTETVVDGVTGFRCRSMKEFVAAIKKAPSLDRRAIRRHVERHYSLAVVGRQYQAYFERLETLWGAGFYAD